MRPKLSFLKWPLRPLALSVLCFVMSSTLLPDESVALPPDGNLDAATPQIVGGWARDRDYIGPVNVHIYIDGVFHKSLLANTPRPDLPCDCAWSWVPPPLGEGRHQVVAYAIGVNAQGVADGENLPLSNSPREIQDHCNGLPVPGQGGTPHEWCLNNNAYWINRPQDTLYLSNRNLRFGVNRSYGGTIFELYAEDHNDNLILEHGGGAIQLSLWGYDAQGAPAFYFNGGCSDETPYPDLASCEAVHGAGACRHLCCSEGAHVANCDTVQACEFGVGAPWNPIQGQAANCAWDGPSNDVSAVGVHEDPPWIHIVKHNPQQFTKSDAFPDLTWEQVARIMPAGLQLDYMVRYTGSRTLTEHPQELPAIFPAHGMHAEYSFYEGAQPWQNQGVRTTGDLGRAGLKMPARGLTGTFMGELSEGWVSVCDAPRARCLTVASFSPLVQQVVVGTGTGEAYLTPMGSFAITPGLDLSWTVYLFPYRYDEVVEGMSIRDHIRAIATSAGCQVYGLPCDDGDACTSNDRCDGAGQCSGDPSCDPPAPVGPDMSPPQAGEPSQGGDESGGGEQGGGEPAPMGGALIAGSAVAGALMMEAGVSAGQQASEPTAGVEAGRGVIEPTAGVEGGERPPALDDAELGDGTGGGSEPAQGNGEQSYMTERVSVTKESGCALHPAQRGAHELASLLVLLLSLSYVRRRALH